MSKESDAKKELKVVIVGGSIAGLTLAHCLTKHGIDFVLLERNKNIAPEVGASIGFLGNGARILDQLGCWDDIEASSEPLKVGTTWTATGEFVMKTDIQELHDARTGYPICFLERQRALEILYSHLPDRELKVFTSKQATHVEHTNTGVIVHCADGTNCSGDIVAGADGVHSFVRDEMQKYAISHGPPGSMEKDGKSMTSEYYAAFGISSPVPGLVYRESHRTYSKDVSTLIICGQDNKVFWFLFKKHAKKYPRGQIPSFPREKIAEEIQPHLGLKITDQVDFAALWKNKRTHTMVSLEESNNEHWAWDRFVCLGDSICKMTPNMGQGGNNAIESAASLANNLARLESLDLAAIKSALLNYENDRRVRANAVADTANDLTRLEALAGWKNKLLALYISPWLKDYLADKMTATIMGAESLDAAPLPKRSLKANMTWDPKTGVGRSEPRLRRAAYALPILAFTYVGYRTMTPTISRIFPLLSAGLSTGSLDFGDGIIATVGTKFFGIPALDSFVRIFVAAFTPAIGGFDKAHTLQAMTFMYDLFPIQVIWTIESLRRGNVFTAAQLATPMALLYQIKGIGMIAPIYYFLHYIQTPRESYASADNRMVPVSLARTLLPAAAVYVPLTYLMFSPALSLSSRQRINSIWQFFPLITTVLHRGLASCVKDTTTHDRIHAPRTDLPALRTAYAVSSAVSFAAYAYTTLSSPVSLSTVYFGGIKSPSAAVVNITQSLAKFFRYDQLLESAAGYTWVLLSFWDLKRAKKLKTGWGKILAAMGLGTLLGGSGTTMGLMWWWREEILAEVPVVED